MINVKIFRAINGNQHIEKEMNDWFKRVPKLDVFTITQSDAGGEDEAGLVISVFYRGAKIIDGDKPVKSAKTRQV